MTVCSTPLDLPELLAYWLGELPPEQEDEVEAHFLACHECAERLSRLAALAAGVRGAVRAGAVSVVVSAPLLAALGHAGLRLREYRVAPGDSVNCTIGAEDDGVLSRLEAPLHGVERLDLVEVEWGTRHEDIPFDPRTGEVLFLPAAAALRKAPAHVLNVRLLAVKGANEEAPLAEYRFVHTPS